MRPAHVVASPFLRWMLVENPSWRKDKSVGFVRMAEGEWRVLSAAKGSRFSCRRLRGCVGRRQRRLTPG